MTPFRVLVCGGRNWHDLAATRSALDQLPHRPTIVIHGGARGADQLAGNWAVENGIHMARVDALWNEYGKSAGMRRNIVMLELRPDYCVAFPGGNGTADMVGLCMRENIPVWEPYGETLRRIGK